MAQVPILSQLLKFFNMKLTIIQTPDYILGVDKEAILRDEDIHISPIREGIMNTFIIDNKIGNDNYKSKPLDRKDCWKVIAHTPLNGNKGLEGVWSLPEFESLDYEFDRKFMFPKISPIIERLRKTDYEAFLDIGGKLYDACFDFYKSSGSYTEEDMRKAIVMAVTSKTDFIPDMCNEIIQSLKPFPIEFEVEMEEYGYEPVIGKFPNYEVNPNPKLFRPKILNNIIQGKYIWKQLN